MNRSDLEKASFWNDTLCLACGYDSEEEGLLECPECGSPHVAPAKEILRFVEALEE